MLSHLDSFSGTMLNFVKSSNTLTSYVAFWIIDSGANKHMTSLSKDFVTYSPCSNQDSIQIADCSFSPIFRTSSIICAPYVKLSSFFMFLNFLLIFYRSVLLPKLFIVKLNSFLIIVLFRTFKLKRRLAMVGYMMACICLKGI